MLEQGQLALMDFASANWEFPFCDTTLNKDLKKERARQRGKTLPAGEEVVPTPVEVPLTMAQKRAKADAMQPAGRVKGAGSWATPTALGVQGCAFDLTPAPGAAGAFAAPSPPAPAPPAPPALTSPPVSWARVLWPLASRAEGGLSMSSAALCC